MHIKTKCCVKAAQKKTMEILKRKGTQGFALNALKICLLLIILIASQTLKQQL